MRKESIAAFEAHHNLTCSGVLEQQCIDATLWHGVPLRLLANIDQLSLSGVGQQGGVGEPVIYDDVGLSKAFDTADGDESRIARPRAYEIDDPAIGWCRFHCTLS